ncbi:MAG: hypothetical protein MPK06_05060 [Alphaproteobacteria bacterium]|nr:hypothetical protein [Alphaproteobacteria bacterium]MDA8005890.1 hypothetical protein [Alphaproteobacteria bacterium]MDA8012800.1 hypothetical protein [Alphaproteobacteria bacterium]
MNPFSTSSRNKRRNNRATQHLDNRLRADIGLPPKSDRLSPLTSIVWPPYSTKLDH